MGMQKLRIEIQGVSKKERHRENVLQLGLCEYGEQGNGLGYEITNTI